MSTKKGKAVPLDREIPDGTAVISVVHPEGNPKGVTVEETVIKDNTSAPRPDIGTNVGEALEQALQKSSDPKPSTKNEKENQKMEEKKTATATNNETVNAKAQPKAETKQPKSEEKPKTAAPAPKAEQQLAAEANPQQLGDMIAELKTLKESLGSTKIEVEHHRSLDTGSEAKHQFLVGLATGAGVALGVTVVTTAAWLIQRKLSGGNDSSAE